MPSPRDHKDLPQSSFSRSYNYLAFNSSRHLLGTQQLIRTGKQLTFPGNALAEQVRKIGNTEPSNSLKIQKEIETKEQNSNPTKTSPDIRT